MRRGLSSGPKSEGRPFLVTRGRNGHFSGPEGEEQGFFGYKRVERTLFWSGPKGEERPFLVIRGWSGHFSDLGPRVRSGLFW